jgi:ribonuclease BN (tRNA processing enzyme)
MLMIAAIVEQRHRSARLNVDAVARLGVPKGKMLGELKAGRSVTLANGCLVQPSDVLDAARPGRTLLHLGDTCSSENAIKIAKGADWVVHESTFDDASEVPGVTRSPIPDFISFFRILSIDPSVVSFFLSFFCILVA